MKRIAELARLSWMQLIANRLYLSTQITVLAIVVFVFSIVWSVNKAIFITDLPYPDVDNIYEISIKSEIGRGSVEGNAPAFARTMEDSSGKDWLSGYTIESQAKVRFNDTFYKAKLIYSSKNYFELFPPELLVGRSFLDFELREEGSNSVVISYQFAKSLTPRTEGLIGRQLEIDGKPKTIIGIYSDRYTPPQDISGQKGDVWTSRSETLGTSVNSANWTRSSSSIKVYLRANWRDPLALNEYLSGYISNLLEVNAKSGMFANAKRTPQIIPIRDAVFGSLYSATVILSITVVLLSVFAFSVLISMSTTRAHRRNKINALYHAVGATYKDINVISVFESLLICFSGLVLGIVAAAYTLLVLDGNTFATYTLPVGIQMEWDTALLAILMSFITIVACTYFVARNINRHSIIGEMASSGKGSTIQTVGSMKYLVLGFQLIVAVITITLLLESAFKNLEVILVDTGIDNPDALILELDIPSDSRSEPSRSTQVAQIKSDLSNTLDFSAVSSAHYPPLFKGAALQNINDLDSRTIAQMQVNGVDANYFKILGLELIEGVLFKGNESRNVAIVGLRAYSILKEKGKPIGSEILYDNNLYQIVGVVEDISNPVVNVPGSELMLYVPYKPIVQSSTETIVLLSNRTNTTPEAIHVSRIAGNVNSKLFIDSYDTVSNAYHELVSAYRSRGIIASVVMLFVIALVVVGSRNTVLYLIETERKRIATYISLGAPWKEIFLRVSRTFLVLVPSSIIISGLLTFSLIALFLTEGAISIAYFYGYAVASIFLTLLVIFVVSMELKSFKTGRFLSDLK